MQREDKGMNTEILLGECHSPDHQYLFCYIEDDTTAEVSIQPHLVKRPFLSRVLYAFKYIFGYKCRYGAWDEFVIDKKDIPKFQKVIAFLEKTEEVDENFKLKQNK